MAKLSFSVLTLLLLVGATLVVSQEETPEPEPTIGPTGLPTTTEEDTPTTRPTTPSAGTTQPPTSAPTSAATTTRSTNGTTVRPTTKDDCEYDFIPDVDCPPFEPELPTYFPYPYDCTKFIECTNGEPEVHCCAEGTIWDQALETCNHPSQTQCIIQTTQATTPTTPTTTTPTTTTPTTTTPTTTTPTTTTPTTTTPTTTTTEPTTEDPGDPASWICPEGYLGPIGHPYNCSYFYICDPGRRPCLFPCSPPLYYNPETEECDWSYNVPSCQAGTPPPPTTTRSPLSGGDYRTAKRFFKSNIKEIVEQRKKMVGLFYDDNVCDEPTNKPIVEFY